MSSSPSPPFPAAPPLALLSFDVEEFDIPLEYGGLADPATQIRVGAEGLERVLDLLARHDWPATFFTTASFAKARPELMRRVVDAGIHEIASHGLTHAPPVEADLLPARVSLEDQLGVPIVGYRSARMVALNPEAVAASGHVYNASENPIWLPGRYNRFFEPRTPYPVQTRSGPLVHIPASASPVLRVPLFWLAFKNLPMPLIRWATRQTLTADGAMNTYFHPWEFTDLSAYTLPRVVRRLDGETLTRRLDAYITFLSRHARPARYREYAARFLPAGTVTLPSAAHP